MASVLVDATTYAAATLGLLSGNKDQVVTTVTTPKSKDDRDNKLPAVDTLPKLAVDMPLKLKDPPDQQGMINMAPNRNITVRVILKHSDAVDDGLGNHGCPGVWRRCPMLHVHTS